MQSHQIRRRDSILVESVWCQETVTVCRTSGVSAGHLHVGMHPGNGPASLYQGQQRHFDAHFFGRCVENVAGQQAQPVQNHDVWKRVGSSGCRVHSFDCVLCAASQLFKDYVYQSHPDQPTKPTNTTNTTNTTIPTIPTNTTKQLVTHTKQTKPTMPTMSTMCCHEYMASLASL